MVRQVKKAGSPLVCTTCDLVLYRWPEKSIRGQAWALAVCVGDPDGDPASLLA